MSFTIAGRVTSIRISPWYPETADVDVKANNQQAAPHTIHIPVADAGNWRVGQPVTLTLYPS